MIHVHRFLKRNENCPESAFDSRWQAAAKRLQASAQLQRFALNSRIAFEGAESPYDGSEDYYVDDLDALAALRASSAFLQYEEELAQVTSLAEREWMITFDRVMREGAVGPGHVRAIFQLKRRRGTTPAQLRDYWGGTHGDLGLKIPGMRRYIQSYVVDEVYQWCEPGYDGIAQEWFDDLDALRAAFQSPEGRTSNADGKNFLDMSVRRIFVAKEYLVGRD